MLALYLARRNLLGGAARSTSRVRVLMKALAASPPQTLLYSSSLRNSLAPFNGASGANGLNHAEEQEAPSISYHIPQRVRDKVISAEDAIALVSDGGKRKTRTVPFLCFVSRETLMIVQQKIMQRRHRHSPSLLLFI
jgi:hypothetical protein